MEKNENGYPVTPRMGEMNGNRCRMENGCTGEAGACGGTTYLDTLPLAYVYAPNQNFRLLYSAEEALKHGTLFKELYKPKEVYGRE